MGKINVCDLGSMDYMEALNIQYDLLEKRQNDLVEDTILLVEHPPVLTMGIRTDRNNIFLSDHDMEKLGVSCYEVNRGGDVTYHGPGQLVGYPIMKIDNFPGSVRGYVGSIENALIDLLKSEYQINAHKRQDKYTGVWIGDEKIVAIGIAVKKWVTMHGFAFNVNTDLSHFNWINPCGLSMGVTSVEKIKGCKTDFSKIKKEAINYLSKAFDRIPVEIGIDDLTI